MTTETRTISSQPKPRIRHLAGARYLVESFTRPGLGHQVDVLRLTCGCEAGRYNRRCRHLVLALELDTWRKREEARARAASRSKASAEQASVQAANWSSRSDGTLATMAQPTAAPQRGERPEARGERSQEQAHGAAQGPWHESAAYRSLAECFGL